MADLGQLKLKISGETDDLDKALKVSTKQIALFAAAAAAAAIVIVTKLVKAQLKAIDAAAKLADKLGITMEIMGGLEHIAQITGTSVQTMGRAMQRLDVELTRANEGIGYAGPALERLGLSTRELIGLNPEEAFFRVAESLQGMTDRTMQSRIAMDLFGRQGLEMLGTIRRYGSSLNELSQEARALGLTMSRETAAKVEQFNDQIWRIKATAIGLARQFTVNLTPALTSVADAVVDLLREGEPLRRFFDGFLEVVRDVSNEIVELNRVMREGDWRDVWNVLTNAGPILDEPAPAGGGGRRRRGRTTPGAGAGGGQENRLNELRKALSTEAELEQQRYEDQLVANLNFFEQRMISQQEFNENMELIEDF